MVFVIRKQEFFTALMKAERGKGMDGKIRARFFLRRFFHMQKTIWEWNVEKLEGGSSQIPVPYHFRAVDGVRRERSVIIHVMSQQFDFFLRVAFQADRGWV